jgi:hypothetical protein
VQLLVRACLHTPVWAASGTPAHPLRGGLDMDNHTIRGVWFAIAVLAAAGVGTLAGLLSGHDGKSLATAVKVGAGAFGGALTLLVIALKYFLD